MNRDRYLAAINSANNTYGSRYRTACAILEAAEEVRNGAALTDSAQRAAQEAYDKALGVYRRAIDAAKAERDRAYIAALETELGDRE